MNNTLDDNEKDFSKYHPSIPNFFSLLNPSLFFPHSYYLQIRKIKNKKQFHSTFIMLDLGKRRIFFSYAKGIVYCVYLYILPQHVRVHNRVQVLHLQKTLKVMVLY